MRKKNVAKGEFKEKKRWQFFFCMISVGIIRTLRCVVVYDVV